MCSQMDLFASPIGCHGCIRLWIYVQLATLDDFASENYPEVAPKKWPLMAIHHANCDAGVHCHNSISSVDANASKDAGITIKGFHRRICLCG